MTNPKPDTRSWEERFDEACREGTLPFIDYSKPLCPEAFENKYRKTNKQELKKYIRSLLKDQLKAFEEMIGEDEKQEKHDTCYIEDEDDLGRLNYCTNHEIGLSDDEKRKHNKQTFVRNQFRQELREKIKKLI